MTNKVSILTPVYNGENYIKRYIDSIIEQQLNNFKIELIIIDDGSKDKTKDIISNYIIKTKNSNIEIKYIYQENSGQAAAIAKGIKEITGEFMVWADSDDYFEKNAISKMINYLRNNNDVDVVRCNAYARNEENLNSIVKELKVSKKHKNKTNIFEDCIFINGINIFAGVYMVRFSKYLKNNPKLFIYEGREGQNWQLLLPSLYNNKCHHLEEFVYNYVIRNNSHSHTKRNYNEKVSRIDGLRNNLIKTIEILKLENSYKTKLLDKINEVYDIKLYLLDCKYNNKKDLKKRYKKIKNKNIKIHIAYLIGTNTLINKLYKAIKKEV